MGEVISLNPDLKVKSPEYIDFLFGRVADGIKANKPELAQMMVDFALTPNEHLEALDNIFEYCFKGKSPSDTPKIFLVISQTGGGKSGLTAEILRNNPNTVVIDSDAFKAFNPKKHEIEKNYPTLYGFLTGLDAYLHRDEIYDWALDQGYNVLIEVAPSTKERLFNINFEELLAHGYKIEANILAVSLANSLVSVHERFEGQIEGGMDAPKLTDLKRATDSFDAVELILKDILDLDFVDLKVWRRGKFSNEDEEMVPPPQLVSESKETAQEDFKNARVQDESLAMETIDERIQMVKDSMKQRNAPEDQIEQFKKIIDVIEQAKKALNIKPKSSSSKSNPKDND